MIQKILSFTLKMIPNYLFLFCSFEILFNYFCSQYHLYVGKLFIFIKDIFLTSKKKKKILSGHSMYVTPEVGKKLVSKRTILH